jgi:hypothetical protein
MTFAVHGIDPGPYAALFGLADEALAANQAARVFVDEQPGFPCRVTLDDAPVGTAMLLVNHVSHDVANPYRASHAMFVTEGARDPAHYVDVVPPALDRRILSLRGFDRDGMMVAAALAQPGEAEAGIRTIFEIPEVAYIHAHNAVRGCFAARVERQ